MVSNHYKTMRNRREKFIESFLGGDGEVIDDFIVDRGHPKGPEMHRLTSNGIIIVYNLWSGKLVTRLIARPQQVKRYYEATGWEPPPEYEHVLELARTHNILGYNGI